MGIDPIEHHPPVFKGNTAITPIAQETLRGPILRTSQCFPEEMGENSGIEIRTLGTSLN